MADNDEPTIVIEGLETIIKRDLAKHRVLHERTQTELDVFRQSRSHLIKRKKHFRKLIGGGKYDDDALRRSMDGIATDIRHLSDKCKLAEEKIQHHAFIIETLTKQLEKQDKDLDVLAKYREEREDADRH